jgi:FkbM family methyltransferase
MTASTGTLRQVRDGLIRLPGIQTGMKYLGRRGLVPPALTNRLQPYGTHTVRSPVGGEFRYVVSRRDVFARSVVWTDLRTWEATTQPVLVALARGARTFVDAGAYTGIYSLLACAVNPELRVIAFEPNPTVVGLLRDNIAANNLDDRVRVVHKALSDRAGRVPFAVGVDTTAGGLRRGGPDERSFDVDVVRADEALDGEPVDLVKLDVEGAEISALKGMRGVLRTFQPRLIVECLRQETLAELFRLLEPFGYRSCHYLGPDGPVIATAATRAVPRYANFLFSVSPGADRPSLQG